MSVIDHVASSGRASGCYGYMDNLAYLLRCGIPDWLAPEMVLKGWAPGEIEHVIRCLPQGDQLRLSLKKAADGRA